MSEFASAGVGLLVGLMVCIPVGHRAQQDATERLQTEAVHTGNAYHHPITGEFTWTVGECWPELEAQTKLDSIKRKDKAK